MLSTTIARTGRKLVESTVLPRQAASKKSVGDSKRQPVPLGGYHRRSHAAPPPSAPLW
jgi:hypothetical protein